MISQGICIINGCKLKQTKHKNYKDKCGNIRKYYRPFCVKHNAERYGLTQKRRERTQKWIKKHPEHRIKYDYSGLTNNEYQEIRHNKCSVCGWNKTTCDFHRIEEGKYGGKYKKDNIIVLCPNCHKLVHRKLLKI